MCVKLFREDKATLFQHNSQPVVVQKKNFSLPTVTIAYSHIQSTLFNMSEGGREGERERARQLKTLRVRCSLSQFNKQQSVIYITHRSNKGLVGQKYALVRQTACKFKSSCS